MRWSYAALLLCFACGKSSKPVPPPPAPAPVTVEDDTNPVWELTADGTVTTTTSLDWKGGALAAAGPPTTVTEDGSSVATFSITQRCRQVPGSPDQIVLTDCDAAKITGSMSSVLDEDRSAIATGGRLDQGTHMDFGATPVADGTRIEVVLQLQHNTIDSHEQSIAVSAAFKGKRTNLEWKTGEPEKTSSSEATEVVSAHNLTLDVTQVVPAQLYEAVGEDSSTKTEGNDATVKSNTRLTVTIRKLTSPNEVAAVPKITGGVYRGDTITFDASESTPKGKLREYRWEFTPGASCPSGISIPPATKPVVTFRSLCPIVAKLTVRGGDPDQTISASRHVAVSPRPWRTTFVQHADPWPLLNHKLAAKGSCPECTVGRNVCTKEGLAGEQTSGHFLHHTDPQTWDGVGFTVEQIHDGGPFDGWWYISKQDLVVERTPLVNSEFFSGPLPRANQDACKANKQSQCDFDALLGLVTAHERTHGQLVREQLRRHDPAIQLEQLIRDGKTTRAAFVGEADTLLRTADGAFGAASTDDKVVARLKQAHPEWDRSAQVLIRAEGDPSKTTEWTIPNLASLGD
jgi:hypothetical protein